MFVNFEGGVFVDVCVAVICCRCCFCFSGRKTQGARVTTQMGVDMEEDDPSYTDPVPTIVRRLTKRNTLFV